MQYKVISSSSYFEMSINKCKLSVMSKRVKRLYAQFAPEHYDVHIKIAEDKESFSGSVAITGSKKGRPSKRITLHQKGLKISQPRVSRIDKKGSSSNVSVSRVVTHKAYDELRIHSDDILYPGTYKISLDFTGVITKNMDGVYPCFYKYGDIEKRLIATQFESHHAREAFPCIDEPEAKATFQLTLDHDSNETALSNTLPQNEKDKNGVTTTTFGVTPIMSTYLLAFVVGELEKKETTSSRGVVIRTFATKDQVEHTQFALEEAAQYMDFYEKYYDIAFPLEKCDFVALPDFASGAMENWGLITFREQVMLVDKEHTSLNTKQYVAIVVAHELTHQWFGNLVTMEWWTDLWLNEGFASWMEYLAVNDRHPEWHLWTQFSVDEQQLALKMDSLENTHPIEVEVKHPDEIRTIFDVISYQKGASIIHMLHDYLGADNFRDGLRKYLKKHAYENTHTVDLWQSLEDATNKPVKDFMHSWTSQSGFPILTVSKAQDHLRIEQSKFVTNPLSSARNDDTTWPVPLLSEGIEKATVTKKISNVPLTDPKTTPIKINNGQTGFYRVDYSHDLQNAQIEALKKGDLSEIDRMGLLSDGFETTKAGYQSVTEYLDLLETYRSEDSLPVWEIIAGSVTTIRGVLSRDDTDDTLRDLMKPFVKDLVAPQLRRLTLTSASDEPHLDTLLRSIIVGLAAAADDEKVVGRLLQMYRSKIDKKMTVDPNIRGIIYSVAARKGGQKEYKELLALYKKSTSSDEKLSIAAAMTSFKQSELHEKVLNLVREEHIKFQDVPYWIAYSFMNRHSRKTTWEWFKKNWPWLKQNMGTDLSFSRFPIYAARTFSDKELCEEYTEFFTSHMEPMIERTYAQGLEMVQTNSQWRLRDSEAAISWFKAR